MDCDVGRSTLGRCFFYINMHSDQGGSVIFCLRLPPATATKVAVDGRSLKKNNASKVARITATATKVAVLFWIKSFFLNLNEK